MLPEAIPYHLKVRDYFRRHASTRELFAAVRTGEEQLVASQTDLLKNARQLSREGEPALFEAIDRVREALELTDLRVTAYQAADQSGNELNTSTIFLPGEAHLVLKGSHLEKLDKQELMAVIAREMAHVRLYTLADGEIGVADRIVKSIVNDAGSGPVYLETARLFSLYTEIYCDRCAYTVLGDATAVITMLEKPDSLLTAVSRTRALHLWRDQGEAAVQEIARMIEGVPDFGRMDLLFREELNALTYDVLQEYLRPGWFRTEPIIGLGKQYFPNWGEREGGRAAEEMASVIGGMHIDIRTYFAYVLLDFVLADPSLGAMAGGRALEFAGLMRIADVYDTICQKELQLNDKKWQQNNNAPHGTNPY
jgi:hypothetical protein